MFTYDALENQATNIVSLGLRKMRKSLAEQNDVHGMVSKWRVKEAIEELQMNNQ